MKKGNYKIALIVVAVIVSGGFASADGLGGNSGAGSMMGGESSGHGMMGGPGRSMMDYGQGVLNLWKQLFNKQENFNQNDHTEIELLRKQIREKRQELSVLLRSDKPDKALIDRKIEELNWLEYELDNKFTTSTPREK
jgi:Spy/CpxP family protein refolding chaperone